jgi:hypothetical protein
LKSIIAISDLHVGSTVGLCAPGTRLIDGGTYGLNKFQETLWNYWKHFWKKFVPEVCEGSKSISIVINGDCIDNVHHGTVNIFSNDIEIQEVAATRVIESIYEFCPLHISHLFMVIGTEVHSGPAGESERRIARTIHAEPDEDGNIAPYQRWIYVDNTLFQFAHHIGVTSSAAYESSAPMREMVAGMVEAAEWGRPLPDVFVRSHRHRFIEVPVPTENGRIRAVITPSWQLRTPFVERIDRMRMPHIGCVVFNVERKLCQVREKLYPLPDPAPTKL